ncbi:hypothetical protein PIB30_040418, partial [Stylosanthes scabra]|nr:hypothetical protein [Stylosanthes scabra]
MAEKTCVVCDENKEVCSNECIYEPLFPAEDDQKKRDYFTIKAHLLALDLTTLLPKLQTMEERREAISALLWQAKAWEKDPIHGAMAEFNDLKQALKDVEEGEDELKNAEESDAEDDDDAEDNENLIQEDRKLPPKKR